MNRVLLIMIFLLLKPLHIIVTISLMRYMLIDARLHTIHLMTHIGLTGAHVA